jgi:hypothetical protein
MYAYRSAQAYLARADLQVRQGDIAAAQATVKEITTIITRIRPHDLPLVQMAAAWYALLGTRATTIQATQWLGDAPPTAPAAGTPTLLVFVFSGCGYRDMDTCYPNYVVLRRLVNKHPDLPVTLVTRTEGYYRTQLVSADSETTLVGDYFTNVVKLRAPIAVWHTQFNRRSDSYMMAKPNPNDVAYRIVDLSRTDQGAPIAFLIDANGVIRYVAPLTWFSEAMLDHAMSAIMHSRADAADAGSARQPRSFSLSE